MLGASNAHSTGINLTLPATGTPRRANRDDSVTRQPKPTCCWLDRSQTIWHRLPGEDFPHWLKRGCAAPGPPAPAVPGMRPGGRSGRGRFRRPPAWSSALFSPRALLSTQSWVTIYCAWDGRDQRVPGRRKPQPAPPSAVGSSDPLTQLPYRHRSRSPSCGVVSGQCADPPGRLAGGGSCFRLVWDASVRPWRGGGVHQERVSGSGLRAGGSPDHPRAGTSRLEEAAETGLPLRHLRWLALDRQAQPRQAAPLGS